MRFVNRLGEFFVVDRAIPRIVVVSKDIEQVLFGEVNDSELVHRLHECVAGDLPRVLEIEVLESLDDDRLFCLPLGGLEVDFALKFLLEAYYGLLLPDEILHIFNYNNRT